MDIDEENAATIFAYGKVWININLLRDVLNIPLLKEVPGGVVVVSLAEVLTDIENDTVRSITDQMAIDNDLGK